MIFWSNVLIPVASMIITVFATLYTVSKRVENENKEKHKPYLTLNDIEHIKQIDEYKYYLTINGQNFIEKFKKSQNNNKENKEKEQLEVMFLLDNIGYGVASNIKFYDLLTSKEIKGTQTPSKEKNQKLFTTFDIAVSQEKKVQVKINSILKEERQEYCKLLCVYQDLNGHIYDFVININIKSNNSYDFYTYQRTSHSYTKCIKDNELNYNAIIKEYKK